MFGWIRGLVDLWRMPATTMADLKPKTAQERFEEAAASQREVYAPEGLIQQNTLPGKPVHVDTLRVYGGAPGGGKSVHADIVLMRKIADALPKLTPRQRHSLCGVVDGFLAQNERAKK